MRALLFNSKEFMVEFDSLANRPKNIVHEDVKGKERQDVKNSVVAFITVEKDDGEKRVVNRICKEIEGMCKDVGRKKVVICPFAHLSNKLAEPKDGLRIIKQIDKILGKKFEVTAAHFGSNKSLLLEIYGHAGNARYREF